MKKTRSLRHTPALNAIIFLLFMAPVSVFGSDAPSAAPLEHKLDIRLMNAKEWEASSADVKKVLYSCAEELWKYFPERKIPPLDVSPKGGPITLFDRGLNGEIRIKLNTGQQFWAQYAYQFAHEMGHVLCDYKSHPNPNHWFEESLCELSSVFVLHRMAETWAVKPPYPNWKSYSPALKKYADERLEKSKLPDGKTFVEWYAENANDLRANSVDREKNNVVAGALLPLFEAEPEMWEAVSFLNTEKLTKLYSFKQYLEAWRRNSQEKHRAFIDKIALKFEIELEKN